MSNQSIKIGADLSGLQRALKEANANIKDCKSNFELVKSSLNGFSDSAEKLGDVINKQNAVVDANAKKVNILKDALDKANNAENKNKEQIEKLEKQLIKAQTAYNKSVKTLNEYKKSQEDTLKKEKESETALGKLNIKIAENKEKLAKAKVEYQNIIISQGKMSNEATDAANRIKNLSKELKDNEEALKDATDASDKFDNSLKKEGDGFSLSKSLKTNLTRQVQQLATDIAANFARSIVNTIKDSITTGINYEKAFTGVRKVVDGTEQDFKELSEEIRKTSLEKPISADTLASLYQAGAQLGIDKNNLKEFTDAVIDLENTSDLTADAGATMIAQYANVMNLPSSEYRRFASTLSYLGSTTATTESRIMELAQRMSGVSASIGLRNQGVLALSTAMGSVGLSAESAGSAMSTIMLNIATAVDKNSEKLKVWADTAGMSTSEFAKLWKTDVMSAVQAVIKGLSDEKAGGESLILTLEELGVSNIRQRATMLQLANAGDLLGDTVKKANEEWERNTFLTESAGKVYESTEAQMKMLENSFNDIKISIFECLQEPMQEAMSSIRKLLQSPEVKESITKFAKNIGNFFVKVFKNTDELARKIKAVGVAVAGIIASFTIGKIITGIGSIINVIQKLVTGIKAATTAQGVFNAVMAANPLGAIATAIGLVITALVSLGIATDGFKSKSDVATDSIKNQTKAFEDNLNTINENAKARDKALSGIDVEYNENEKLITQLKKMVDENGNIKEGYQDRVKTIIPLLQNATGQEIKLIGNQIQGYKQLILTLDQVIAKKKAEAKLDVYYDDYKEAIKGKEENRKKWEEAENKLSEAQEGLKPYEGKDMTFMLSANYSYYKKQKEEAEKQLNLLDETDAKYNEMMEKYENAEKEYYEKYTLPSTQNNITVGVDFDGESSKVEINDYFNDVSNMGIGAVNKVSKAQKEESKTTYKQLLEQEKTYKKQLNEYIKAIKDGNEEVTIEMLQDTKKNLSSVEDKIKEVQSLMNGTLNSGTKKKKVLDDDEDLEDEIDDEIENLYDGDVYEEIPVEIKPVVSNGVIFGKGVLGDAAVEMEGIGREVAQQYLNAYNQAMQEKEAEMYQTITLNATNQANTEAVAYQSAKMLPENMAIYDATEKYVAEQKQTSQAQGLIENAFKVSDAEIQTLNNAKNEALKVDFKTIGNYIVEGIANGIRENAYKAIEATRDLAKAINDAMKSEEDINSPSKVFFGYGKYIDEGLANGIKAYAKEATKQMNNVAIGLQDSIKRINNSINPGTNYGGQNTAVGNTINYNITQNNTSNKSLDTLKLYQQTSSLLKRTVRDIYV